MGKHIGVLACSGSFLTRTIYYSESDLEVDNSLEQHQNDMREQEGKSIMQSTQAMRKNVGSMNGQIHAICMLSCVLLCILACRIPWHSAVVVMTVGASSKMLLLPSVGLGSMSAFNVAQSRKLSIQAVLSRPAFNKRWPSR